MNRIDYRSSNSVTKQLQGMRKCLDCVTTLSEPLDQVFHALLERLGNTCTEANQDVVVDDVLDGRPQAFDRMFLFLHQAAKPTLHAFGQNPKGAVCRQDTVLHPVLDLLGRDSVTFSQHLQSGHADSLEFHHISSRNPTLSSDALEVQ